MSGSICAFSGHRQIYRIHHFTLPTILSETIDTLISSGVKEFRSGGAQGFDLLAAEHVLKRREEGADISLSMYLPCRNQASRWPRDILINYENILACADSVTYVSEEYTQFCMHERNRALVDGADILLCYRMRSTGGTAYTSNYAQSKGVKIINLADLL